MNKTAEPRDITIAMTKGQMKVWAWAKDAMDDFWSTPSEVAEANDWTDDRAEAAVEFYRTMIHMSTATMLVYRGRAEEREALEDVIGDLLYRLEEQAPSMAEQEDTPAARGTARVAEALALLIRERTPRGHDIAAQ